MGVTVIVPGEGDPLMTSMSGQLTSTEKRKGRGRLYLWILITTVTIRRDSDADSSNAENTDELVGGATVQMTLARAGNSFNFSGTTNSEGTVKVYFTTCFELGTTYTATISSVYLIPHTTTVTC